MWDKKEAAASEKTGVIWGSSWCFKIEIITWVSNNNDYVQREFISNEWAESITIYRKEWNILWPGWMVPFSRKHTHTQYPMKCRTDFMHMHFLLFIQNPKGSNIAFVPGPYHHMAAHFQSVCSLSETISILLLFWNANFDVKNFIGQMWLRRMMDFFLVLSHSLPFFFAWTERYIKIPLKVLLNSEQLERLACQRYCFDQFLLLFKLHFLYSRIEFDFNWIQQWQFASP